MHPAFCRVDVVSVWLGEIVVSGAGLVRDVSCENALVDEPRHESLRIGDDASSVVAHVDDQTVGKGERCQHVVKVAFADAV